jgi:hypothetical protein
MGRAPLVAFVAALVIAAVPVWGFLTEPREVIASTPSAYTGLTIPLPVPAGGEACADEILFDRDAEIARFGATAPAGASGPALEIEARGQAKGPYRNAYRSAAEVPGGWTGTQQFDVPLQPPSSAAFGSFCVRNTGEQPIELVGSADGRAFSRPTVSVDGQPVAIELQLRLLEAGRHSLLSRLGDVASHAATLKPLGAWWVWLLALALLVLAPLAVLAAIRSALVADGAREVPERPPLRLSPPEALTRRAQALPGWVIVGALCLLAVLWFSYWGLNTHVFQNDEDQYVYLSRWFPENLPESIWNFDVYGRGLQRLEVWLLAVPALLVDAPWSLAAGRVLNTIAFVSTAIPVYLLGRGLGLSPRWAALPAVLSAVVPGAVVTTAFLTENLAYPAFVWVLYTIWRTTVKPSAAADVLALVTLVIAGGARSALLAFAVVLPIAVAVTALRCGTGRLVERLRPVLTDHLVLWAAIGVALAALLLGAVGFGPTEGLLARFAGGYGTPFAFDVLAVIEKTGSYFSRAVVGTAFLPAAVGVPWLVGQLLRSRDPADFAFALTVVVSVVVLFYTLTTAGPDERYIVYLAPLLLLSATLALARRELSPAGVAVTSVLLAALLIAVTWKPEQGPFSFFIWPVESFYARTAGLRLDRVLPGDAGTALTLVSLALGLGGVALAVALWRVPHRLSGSVAVALVAAVALGIVVQTQYALSKHVNGVGSRSGPGLKQRAFADVNVPRGATVGELAVGAGQQPDFSGIWQEVQFYNQRIDTVFAFGDNVNPVPPGDDLVEGITYDAETGLVRSPRPLADYLVIPTPAPGLRLRGAVVSVPAYVPVALIQVAQPPTVAWRTQGIGPDGAPVDDEDASVRVYGTGLRPGAHCVSVTLGAPPDRSADWALRIGKRTVRSGQLAAMATRAVSVELPRLVEDGFVDVHLEGGGRLLGIEVDDGC